MNIYQLVFYALFFVVTLIGSNILLDQKAGAADLSRFRADLIIDDASFTDNQSMSVNDIQNFLNQKGSVCLKDFRSLSLRDDNGDGVVQDSSTEQYGPETMSAAELIKAAADIYKISPRVLLVTLQKEQGLINRTNCPAWRYNTALGYGCPDTAACSESAYGFTRQIDYGTYHFRGFFDDTLPSVPYSTGDNRVYYHPDLNRCGFGTVNIKNRATASLYSYTPYQPNAASLAAGYGLGDDCSSYGNRNFYSYFNDWFNPSEAIRNDLVMTTVAQPDISPAKGQTVTYTVSYKNNSTQPITLDAIGIVARQGSLTGSNKDFGWVGPVTLQAGASQQFTFSSLITEIERLYAWPAVKYQGSYIQYNNWGTSLDPHHPNLTFTSPLTPSTTNITAGQTVTLSATIKNNEDQPIKVDSFSIPVRYYNVYNYDIAPVMPVDSTLAAGASQTVSGSVTLDKPGPYYTWVNWNLGNSRNQLSQTTTLNAVEVTPDFTLTYLEHPNPYPALGEDVNLKFKLKNNRGVPITIDAVGVVGRYDSPYNGQNRDLGWVGPEQFAANEEKVYTTFTGNISDTRKYFTWVAINYKGAYKHYNNWGFVLAPHLPNLTVTSPITINSGSKPNLGETSTVSASIKNNEPKPIKFNAIGIPIRYYGTYNYDAAWQSAGSFAAAGQPGDTIELSGSVIFDKHGPYTLWNSININGRYITIGGQTVINL